jgi:hypothetical protein
MRMITSENSLRIPDISHQDYRCEQGGNHQQVNQILLEPRVDLTCLRSHGYLPAAIFSSVDVAVLLKSIRIQSEIGPALFLFHAVASCLRASPKALAV